MPSHLQAIEKRFQAIAIAMQRQERAAAASGADRKVEKARPEQARRSGRQTQQVCCPASPFFPDLSCLS